MEERLYMIYYGNVPAYTVSGFFKRKGHMKKSDAKIRISQYASNKRYYDDIANVLYPLEIDKLHVVEFAPVKE